jgi:hypothetical protein
MATSHRYLRAAALAGCTIAFALLSSAADAKGATQ